MKWERWAQNSVACGVLAIAWFFGWMGLIGLARADYAHATKAVSELGAWGAPWMFAWNVAGFIGTAVLLAAFAVGYRGVAGWAAPGWRALLFTAVLFGATAIPIEMGPGGDPDLASWWTRAHLVPVVLVPVPWLWALGSIVARRGGAGGRGLAVASAVAMGLLLVQILATVAGVGSSQGVPGLLQRAGFAVVLGWYLAAALLLRGGGVAGSGGGVEGDSLELEADGDRRHHFLRG